MNPLTPKDFSCSQFVLLFMVNTEKSVYRYVTKKQPSACEWQEYTQGKQRVTWPLYYIPFHILSVLKIAEKTKTKQSKLLKCFYKFKVCV